MVVVAIGYHLALTLCLCYMLFWVGSGLCEGVGCRGRHWACSIMEIGKTNEDRSMWKICSSSANKICTWGGWTDCVIPHQIQLSSGTALQVFCKLCKLHVQIWLKPVSWRPAEVLIQALYELATLWRAMYGILFQPVNTLCRNNVQWKCLQHGSWAFCS